MQCADGEETHLRDLANVVEAQVVKIRAGVGAVGDIRLLLMAGLTIADQLADSKRTIEELQNEIAGLRESRSDADNHGKAIEERVAERINNAALRLETLAAEMVARN
jgi:cell division protein ZapA